MEFSFTIQTTHTQFFTLINNDHIEGIVSQHFDFCISLIFMAQNGNKYEENIIIKLLNLHLK